MKNSLSLSRKMQLSVGILFAPVLLMGYFLVKEKDDIISFTEQEQVGVAHARAPQMVAENAARLNRTADTTVGFLLEDASKKAQLNDAKTSENQFLSLLKINYSFDDITAAATGLLSTISDASNITLDPDMDSYFVGDIIINQAPSALAHIESINQSLGTPGKGGEARDIRFAEDKDGLLTNVGTIASELAKAIKGNTDGSASSKLSAAGEAVAHAAAAFQQAVDHQDRAALIASLPPLIDALAAMNRVGDEELDHLLRARVDAAHQTVITRLGISAVVFLLGVLAAMLVIRSVTIPLSEITRLMKRISAGDLDMSLPAIDRSDEVGELAGALEAFHTASVKNEKARQLEIEHQQAEKARLKQIEALNAQFGGVSRRTLEALTATIAQMKNATADMQLDAGKAASQSMSVASAAEEALANVQTVASAAEELAASIRAITDQIGVSASIAHRAVTEADRTRKSVVSLSEATARIDDIATLINQIASKTNLLALNATIEAARAGEAGRGFAVVASEVKTLANQTAKATDDIVNQIGAVRQSVASVSDATAAIDDVVTQINEISASIANAVSQQEMATREIARNVQEAAQGASDVATNIALVSRVIQTTDRTSNDVCGTMATVLQDTAMVEQSIDKYLHDIERI